MNRREFCRRSLAAGAVLLVPFLKACTDDTVPGQADLHSPTSLPPHTPTSHATPTAAPPASGTPDPTATAQPTATLEPTMTPEQAVAEGMATVALVRTTDRASGVRRALELLAQNPVRGSRVLFKPNLNSADPAPASTHPDVMRALFESLENMGARSVTIGERSGMGSTRQVMEQTGMLALAEEWGYDTVVWDELSAADWVVRHDADFHWADGFPVPRHLLDAEAVVQTCNLKTHRYGGHFTMSLKNSVGFVAKTPGAGGYNYMQELHNSPYQRQMIAEINSVYKPALIVLDGVDAFVDGGPARGTRVQTEVVLAGTDPVAVDAAGVAILRLFGTTPEVANGPIFGLEQIARAAELGLGIDAPDKIHFITGDGASAAYAAQIRDLLLLG